MKKIITFLAAAALGTLLGLAVAVEFQVMSVTDGSMFPSYEEGEHILVWRKSGSLHSAVSGWEWADFSLDRGDVILFPNRMYMESGEGEVMMKRIIAVGGDHVAIEDGLVYVNGEAVDESAYVSRMGISGEQSTTYVGQGSYFVLGDNRAESTDSRDVTVGLVKEEDILGKVIFTW